jgi:hypothetical protein
MNERSSGDSVTPIDGQPLPPELDDPNYVPEKAQYELTELMIQQVAQGDCTFSEAVRLLSSEAQLPFSFDPIAIERDYQPLLDKYPTGSRVEIRRAINSLAKPEQGTVQSVMLIPFTTQGGNIVPALLVSLRLDNGVETEEIVLTNKTLRGSFLTPQLKRIN